MTFDYATLKVRHRSERANWPPALSLRVHRALSWLDRAEREHSDPDARFVFLWIAFNAAYGHEIPDRQAFPEQKVLGQFLKRLVDGDQERLLYAVLWESYSGPIRLLIDNPFVYMPFWDFQNGRLDEADWQRRFGDAKAFAHRSIGRSDAHGVLLIVFERLYTLRNQLLHGGATWGGKVNRPQLRDAVAIMDALVPRIIHLMMNLSAQTWGDPSYPVVTDGGSVDR
ncbi:MAG: hypothetical protein V2I57_09640 [Xanthomonadales bacterium]|nr:hypothetical protein [Xanthomonadales bacterium]